MYERLTDQARKVWQLAIQEAQRCNHAYIGTEHILLGLADEGSGIAANVLKSLDIDLPTLRTAVQKMVRPGLDEVAAGKLPATPRAQRVIEYAIDQALDLDHDYVGTEHLLLGILRDHNCAAAQALLTLGLKLENLRDETLRLLGVIPAKTRPAREYDLYLPLRYNDGREVEPEMVAALKRRLTERFGGLTFFPQKSEGTWKIGRVTFRDELVILRVLADDARQARDYFRRLKEELKADLHQEDVLIVERKVRTL